MVSKRLFIFLLFFAVLILAIYGISGMTKINEWDYKILEDFGDIEIVERKSSIVAEVKAEGRRKEAIKIGFRKLSNYVFGDNNEEEEIGMTVPVLQQNIDSFKLWSVRFIMPDNYSMTSLPKPDDNDISILELEPAKFIVLKFSGTVDGSIIRRNIISLMAFAREKKIDTKEEAIIALYSPPWTLSFLKRNEIMIKIED